MQSHAYNPKKIWKKSTIENIDRKNRGVWDILFCALFNAGLYRRNKKTLEDKNA